MAKQLRGDINNDGKISIIDMLLIFDYKSGAILLDADESKRADVDNNGRVEMKDALMIYDHITGEALIDGVIV